MRFRRAYRASIAATAMAAALAGCSGGSGSASGGLEKTNLVVDALPAIDSAGLFIAEQEGLFKREGLNVTIDLASTSQSAIDGQLKGAYDITSADYVTYVDNALQRQAQLRIIDESSFLQPNVLTLLVKKGSGVQSVQQLKNRVVAVNAPDDIGTLLVDSLLSDNGVSLGGVKFADNVPSNAVGQELASGQVAAAVTPEPFVSLDAMTGGTEQLADLDQGVATDFPIQGIAVTRSWAEQNPNTLAAFKRAYAQGQEIADTDRPAVQAAMEKFLGLTPIAAALVSLPDFPIGVDPTRLQRLVDAMLRFGLLPQKDAGFKISTIIDNN